MASPFDRFERGQVEKCTELERSSPCFPAEALFFADLRNPSPPLHTPRNTRSREGVVELVEEQELPHLLQLSPWIFESESRPYRYELLEAGEHLLGPSVVKLDP